MRFSALACKPLGCLCLAACLLVLPHHASADARTPLSVAPETCLECHGDAVSAKQFGASVHGNNGCVSCHLMPDLQKHEDGQFMPKPVVCERCHAREAAQYYASVHAGNGVGCTDCHSNVHAIRHWDGKKETLVATCLTCHEDQKVYLTSVHGRGIEAGNQDSAACSDCHGLHEIKALGPATSLENREFHTKVCLRCHANTEMMKRNGVPTLAVKTYMESFHGRDYTLGYPRLVAGCADCHTSHDVLLPSNPKSTINPANRVKTCRQCHRGATRLFTQFHPHGDYTNRKAFPLLFWTYLGMTALLIFTFAAFWPHTLMWLFRGFIANRELKAEIAEGKHQRLPDGFKVYRRFRWPHISLHLLVIISFLGLALTGLPMRFARQEWARWLMDLYGGPLTAAFIHKICAGILFFAFFVTLLMCLHFLFIRKDVSGNWLQRLFGPDSLMPNLRDLKDLRDMIGWFLFRRPHPSLDRWTYWEKFDFLAVFWGMLAIGGSGLILWMPQFFCHFLPGWVINIAAIVHSEEALLATGFIFSVHFFNAHGQPRKFPMDFVIFNGEITKEELVEERGEQWRRYESEGKTETLRAARTSGAFYDFVFKAFGFGALLIGTLLITVMIFSFVLGSRFLR